MADTVKIAVESCMNYPVLINAPAYNVRREWVKAGQKFMFERELLEQLYYDPGVEFLFRNGYLKCDNKDFMRDVGLLNEEDEPIVVELTNALMKRFLKTMPMAEVKKEIVKLTPGQLEILADYAVEHPEELNLDRAEFLSKASGKNILKAIELAKEA